MAYLEIACFNIESALLAQANGAHRVEFCAGRVLGGVTPSLEDITRLRQKLHIQCRVMVRPRGGGFVYSKAELVQMKQVISAAKEIGVDGFVFGVLREDGTVDVSQNEELVEYAAPLSCTFHRAFDMVSDMTKALEDVIDCGFDTILTSGCAVDVEQGLTNLKILIRQAGDRIVVMPGGGVRSTSLSLILRETGAKYVHSSAIKGEGDIASAEEIKALASQL